MRHKPRRRSRQAQRADRHDLYERAVQETETDIHLIKRVFRRHYGRTPQRLREDFCGTAALACDWVRDHPENRAWGIDLDPEPLEWGRRRHMAGMPPSQTARVKLLEGDARDVGHAKVDVTAAFNFSYFVFKTRDELGHYFEKARGTLLPEGLLFLDAYGGADAQRTCEEQRPIDGFTYVWDQHSYDPISGDVTNYIHFKFRDGSGIRRAFRYDWRLWSLPEIRELLAEAGFRKSEIYWEGTDHRTGKGNNVFTRRDRAPDDPAWICYIVGVQ